MGPNVQLFPSSLINFLLFLYITFPMDDSKISICITGIHYWSQQRVGKKDKKREEAGKGEKKSRRGRSMYVNYKGRKIRQSYAARLLFSIGSTAGVTVTRWSPATTPAPAPGGAPPNTPAVLRARRTASPPRPPRLPPRPAPPVPRAARPRPRRR